MIYMLTPKPFRVFSSIFNTKDTKKTKISLPGILTLAEKHKNYTISAEVSCHSKKFYFCGLIIFIFLVLFVLKILMPSCISFLILSCKSIAPVLQDLPL